jgi:LacI family transcriptional regulator
MKEIARKVGVSTNTVSRAISNKPDISHETRRRILEAAKSLGYPYGRPRAARSKSSRIVGLIVADNSNPFFSRVVKGAEDAASRSGYHLILCNTDEDYQREKEEVELLLERKVDGILITPSQAKREDIARLAGTGTPFVLVGRHFAGMEADFVIADDRGGARLAVEHLLRLGHRHILFINAPDYISSAVERKAGLEDAFEGAGLTLSPDLSRVCAPKQDSAYNLMKAILVEGARFSAVFAFSDLVALGVLQALREARRRVPQDASLVGFDDIEFAAFIDPALTTVRSDRYKLGFESAVMLIERIEGSRQARHVVLPTDLVVRGSTARVE